MRIVTLMTATVLCVTSLTAATSASAQGRRIRPMHPAPGEGVQPRRQALEQQFRQRSEQIVRQRLNLNDDQVNRLRSVNANIGGQRNALLQQERAVRMDLRDEMSKGTAADQSKVSQLMAQAHDLQSKRFALQQDEQQQLSSFMTPVQVAQYVGLQAQIRQRIREMQRGQNGEPQGPDQ
jgi:Spy/CpxP family protein refolding chaperone